MPPKINVSLVSYLNSKPFLYGLQHGVINQQISLSLDTPSECAARIISGQSDIGLIPVAAIKKIHGARIISDFCISAKGKVKSVVLASEVPLNKIDTVMLDNESVTSAALLKILAKQYWKLQLNFIAAFEGYETEIKENKAGLIIGDRALELRNRFSYIYDLANEWHHFTGLPFVFACWVCTKNISHQFIKEFNTALLYGTAHIDEYIASEKFNGMELEAASYLKENIIYRLNDESKKGMQLFLQLIEEKYDKPL